jgi:hypothetical protein
MNWTQETPTTPGWYAWRVGPGERIYPCLARVYNDDDAIRVVMRESIYGYDYDIDELSRREWLGPLPE